MAGLTAPILFQWRSQGLFGTKIPNTASTPVSPTASALRLLAMQPAGSDPLRVRGALAMESPSAFEDLCGNAADIRTIGSAKRRNPAISYASPPLTRSVERTPHTLCAWHFGKALCSTDSCHLNSRCIPHPRYTRPSPASQYAGTGQYSPWASGPHPVLEWVGQWLPSLWLDFKA